jgi:hypothetical protein
MYDWSGQHVIGEKPVTATILRNGEDVYGEFVFGVDTIPYHAFLTGDGKMFFSDVTTNMKERYTPGVRKPYRFDNIQLDIWEKSLRGDMKLYNIEEKEPERPMYIELHSMDDISERNPIFCHVTASPNPHSKYFDAIFELGCSSETKVRIFNQQGVMVWWKSLGVLDSGKHSVTIAPDIQDGTYVLNIATNKQVFRTIIVKKGGVQ